MDIKCNYKVNVIYCSGFSVGHGRSQEDIYKDLQSAGAG